MSDELKTLKEIELKGSTMSIAWNYATIQEEAIKWIKEDRASIEADKKMPRSTRLLLNYLTTKWMRRLDITEKDLKNERR